MRNHPFEKITIKMITDEAGVIRPTFYNYFCDKYEVVEWIFNEYIIEKVRAMFEQKMYTEGLKLLFVCMKNDCAFYRNPLVTAELVAAFYANSLSNLLQMWIQSNNQQCTAENMVEAYAYLLSHRIQDFIDPTENPAEN